MLQIQKKHWKTFKNFADKEADFKRMHHYSFICGDGGILSIWFQDYTHPNYNKYYKKYDVTYSHSGKFYTRNHLRECAIKYAKEFGFYNWCDVKEDRLWKKK